MQIIQYLLTRVCLTGLMCLTMCNRIYNIYKHIHNEQFISI